MNVVHLVQAALPHPSPYDPNARQCNQDPTQYKPQIAESLPVRYYSQGLWGIHYLISVAAMSASCMLPHCLLPLLEASPAEDLDSGHDEIDTVKARLQETTERSRVAKKLISDLEAEMVDMTTASWEAWRSLQHAYRQSEAYRVQRSEFIASLQSTTVQLAAAKALLLAAQSDCVGRLLSKRSGSMDSRLVMAEAHFTALRTTTYQVSLIV